MKSRCPSFLFAHPVVSAVLAVFVFASSNAFAEDESRGIAFVQAPELGDGICFASSPEAGFSCAIAQCMESGAEKVDCLTMRWCQPAGWSADIFMQHKEGIHWHDYQCGWQSEAELDAAIKIMCEGSGSEYLIECAVVQKWQPDGTPVSVQ